MGHGLLKHNKEALRGEPESPRNSLRGLMKEVSLKELRTFRLEDWSNTGCFKLTSNSQPLAIIIVGAVDEMRRRIEALASQIDAGRGK